MGKKILSGIFLVMILWLVFLPINISGAETNYLDEIVKQTPVIKEGNLITIIFKIIRYVLSFLGVAAVVVIVYGGFMWMTAAGNEEKVGKAKKTLQRGLIGLVIILLAYTLTFFVIEKLIKLAKPPTP